MFESMELGCSAGPSVGVAGLYLLHSFAEVFGAYKVLVHHLLDVLPSDNASEEYETASFEDEIVLYSSVSFAGIAETLLVSPHRDYGIPQPEDMSGIWKGSP